MGRSPSMPAAASEVEEAARSCAGNRRQARNSFCGNEFVFDGFWSAPGSAVLAIHRGGSDRPPQLRATTGRVAPTAADLPPETGWSAATISGLDQQLNDTAAKN